MLKSWSIENFKSIVNSGELQLAPVTVLAGLNSSGKSSFLQSILMIAQTLSSRVLERPLLPNGAIIQLGTFDDILNENSISGWLKVSFELVFDREETDLSLRPGMNMIKYFTARDLVASIAIDARFRGAHEKGVSNSAIESSKVVVEDVSIRVVSNSRDIVIADLPGLQETLFPEIELENGVFDFSIKNVSREEIDRFLKNIDSSYLRLLPSTEDKGNYLGNFNIKDVHLSEEEKNTYLVSLSHFLPARLLRRFKIKTKQAQDLRRNLKTFFTIRGAVPVIPSFPDISFPEMAVSENLKASIRKICLDGQVLDEFNGKNMNDLRYWLEKVKIKRRGITRENLILKVIKAISQDLQEDSIGPDVNSHEEAEGLESSINSTYVINLEHASDQVVRFFSSKIRYLGPLRADPQAVQRFAPSSELDEVGAKGEYAAAVYDANQNARIEWYNPASKQIEQGTLKSALDNWAEYLKIAHQIKIEEAGQSGVSWQVVHKEGFKPRPLASVGVGVSQILPILVMDLLAPKNTLLLIEQPELHLHPRVQARLGDFFVGLAKCNKQCLIETHSENLVSQLRYHIVQAGGQEKSDCMIYFVDQDETGASRFDPVEISPNGNILNWPDGFFDETMLQEDRITAASLKRRAGNAQKG
jgi:predicted ATPase